MGKKIAGVGGSLLAFGAALFHLVNSSAVPEKYLPVYVGLGTLLALFGKNPMEKTDNTGK